MKFQLFLPAALISAILCHGAGAADLEETVRRYSADRFTLSRAYELPWSQTRLDRFEKLYGDWQAKLPQLDFNSLNQQGRIDYILLRNELTAQVDQQTLQRERLKEMEELLSFRGAIQELEAARWRMQPLDGQTAATKVSEIGERVKQLKERVEKGKKKSDKTNDTASASASKDKPEESPLKVSASLARRAAGAIGEVRGTLRNWYSFYDGYQPDFSWWLKKPYDDAIAALDGYAKYLREEVAELKG